MVVLDGVWERPALGSADEMAEMLRYALRGRGFGAPVEGNVLEGAEVADRKIFAYGYCVAECK